MEERLNVFRKATTLLDGMAPALSAAFASLRPRSKNTSARSTRISVLRTSDLPCQSIPLSLKARFDSFEALKSDSGYLAPVVTVMLSVR